MPVTESSMSLLDKTGRLFLGLGQYGLLLGPVRRTLVEPVAASRNELLPLLLCHYGRCLWEAGLIAGSCGNLSCRIRSGDAIYLTPHGVNKGRLHVQDIIRVSLSEPDAVSKHASLEYPAHRACYLASDLVRGVIHAHPPALTALGIRGLDLARYLPEAAASLGRVETVPYAPSGSLELARSVGAAVENGATVVILERHGAITVGRDLAEAYDRMEFAELSAKTVLLAEGIGPCV